MKKLEFCNGVKAIFAVLFLYGLMELLQYARQSTNIGYLFNNLTVILQEN